MTEYWKSVGNYYCDYCRLFIRNDAFNRKQHEASPRHEYALKRQVRDIHRKSEREARDAAHANREIVKMGGKPLVVAAAASASAEPGVKTVRLGRPKGGQQQQQPPRATLDDAAVYSAVLAAQAIPGQWSAVSGADEGQEEEVTETETKIEQQQQQQQQQQQEEEEKETVKEETRSALQRRRHDGADEELVGFSVKQKRSVMHEADSSEEAGAAAIVMFKKKKKNCVA